MNIMKNANQNESLSSEIMWLIIKFKKKMEKLTNEFCTKIIVNYAFEPPYEN